MAWLCSDLLGVMWSQVGLEDGSPGCNQHSPWPQGL